MFENVGNNQEANRAQALVQRPITVFEINNEIIFDYLVKTKDVGGPDFGYLSRKDPILILNPCQITEIGLDLEQQDPEELRFGMLKEVTIGYVDYKQQQRKRKMIAKEQLKIEE